MKTHYTYLVTNVADLDNPMFYIGVRSCDGLLEDDAYMGSSKLLQADIKRLGRDCFSKKILQVFGTRKEAAEHEIELHAYYDVAASDHFYNRARALTSGFSTAGIAKGPPSVEHRAKMSAAKKGCVGRKQSAETRAKLSAARKGVPLSAEHFAKVSAARKGVPQSAETRAKLSAAKKGIPQSAEHIAKRFATRKANIHLKESN